MELFDPQDIRDPMLLLQKVFQANKKPVSVSLPVTEPYFIFTTPRAIDKIAGRYLFFALLGKVTFFIHQTSFEIEQYSNMYKK